MKRNKNITIYGAGMSGLIAAIDLAKNGYSVTVHDKEKGYGGDHAFNPSAHTTPLYIKPTSEYIGIDISPVFHPLEECKIYFHDTAVDAPVAGVYTVERGNRPTSLDTLLYNEALKHDIKFEFNSRLKKSDIAGLPQDTIIACGLTAEVYRMLEIPHLEVHGWAARGEIDFSNRSWIWLDECVSEYGYLSSVNNYYFNLLFSDGPVSRQALEKYRDFMRRVTGIDHPEWIDSPAVVPVASRNNPRLFQKNLILCGTITGYMDPKLWFGISGALVSGKIAALAVYNREKAQKDFIALNKFFRRGYFIKKYLWSGFLRPRVGMMEKLVKRIGQEKVKEFGLKNWTADKHLYGSIPGFANSGAARDISDIEQ